MINNELYEILSSEAESYWASQKVFVWWNLEFHYHFHKNQLLDSIRNQINKFVTKFHSIAVRFILVLPSHLTPCNPRILSTIFLIFPPNTASVSLFYVTHQSYAPWFNHHYNIFSGTVDTTLRLQFSPTSVTSFLISKYHHYLPVLEFPVPVPFLFCGTKLDTHQKQQGNL